MKRYSVYCTEEQTKKAIEIGAPVNEAMSRYNSRLVYDRIMQGKETREEYNKRGIAVLGKRTYNIPTTEQMIGWLDFKGVICEIYYRGKWYYDVQGLGNNVSFSSRKEATLASISVALDYLTKIRYDKNNL